MKRSPRALSSFRCRPSRRTVWTVCSARSSPTLEKKYRGQLVQLFLDLQKKCGSAEISSKALDLRGLLDALRLIRRGVSAGTALDMGITNKAFDAYEQSLIRDVIAARIPEARPQPPVHRLIWKPTATAPTSAAPSIWSGPPAATINLSRSSSPSKADGTPDFYMNCVIGLVRKWLGDEMPRRLFALLGGRHTALRVRRPRVARAGKRRL